MANLPQSNRLLSVEAVIALILALINLALDQADIHIVLISWISISVCVALAIDALRRSAWVAHPEQGKARFWVGSSGLVLAFVAFGVFLSLHKKAEANPTQIATQATTQPFPIQPELPKATPLPAPQPKASKAKPTAPAPIAPRSEATPRIGNDNTLVNVPAPPKLGNGNTIIGPTDSNGNTIYNRGGTAIGAGATADPTSIAIGAGAHAGGTNTNVPVIVQPGGAASFGQQGGITAGTINIGTGPWIMSQQIKDQMTGLLRPLKPVPIRIISEAESSRGLQADFLDVLNKRLHWPVGFSTATVFGVPSTGVSCRGPEESGDVMRALEQSLGIVCETKPLREVQITLGERP